MKEMKIHFWIKIIARKYYIGKKKKQRSQPSYLALHILCPHRNIVMHCINIYFNKELKVKPYTKYTGIEYILYSLIMYQGLTTCQVLCHSLRNQRWIKDIQAFRENSKIRHIKSYLKHNEKSYLKHKWKNDSSIEKGEINSGPGQLGKALM